MTTYKSRYSFALYYYFFASFLCVKERLSFLLLNNGEER